MRLSEVADEDYCYLTTVGRRSGAPHEIEIWFGLHGRTLYLLSGSRERSDWVRNLLAEPAVTVTIDDTTWRATARVVTDEHEEDRARRLLASKYQGWRDGQVLSDWGRNALPVAIDVGEVQTPG